MIMDNLDHDQRKMIMPNKKYLSGKDVFRKERIEEYRKLGLPAAQKALEDDWKALSNNQRNYYEMIYDEANQEYLSDLAEVERLRYKPKPPLSAEERFYNSVSAQVEQDHPDLNEAQRNKIHKKMWERMDSEERKPFVDEYESDMIAYNQALKERELKFEQQREKMSKPGNGIYVQERLYGFSEPVMEALIKSRKRELVSLDDPPKKRVRPAKQDQKQQEPEEQFVKQEKGLKKKEKSQKQKEQKEQKDQHSQTVEQPIKQEKAQKKREISQKQKQEQNGKEKHTENEEQPVKQEKAQKKREISQKQKKEEQKEKHTVTEEEPVKQDKAQKKREKSQKQKKEEQKEKHSVTEEEPVKQEKGQKKREKSQKQKQEQKKVQKEQHSQTEEQPIVQQERGKQEKGKKEKSQKQREQKQQKEEKEKSPLRKDNIQQKKEAPAKRGRSKE